MSLSSEVVIRAWKDPAFRATLSAEVLALLPANPAGDRVAVERLSWDAKPPGGVTWIYATRELCCGL
jgi:mersacidin/lichenicidin family type 2 lantibiotic